MRKRERVQEKEEGAREGNREFFIDNPLVRIHFIIEMIRCTGLAPWDSEFTFPGSLRSTFLQEKEGSRGGESGCHQAWGGAGTADAEGKL